MMIARTGIAFSSSQTQSCHCPRTTHRSTQTEAYFAAAIGIDRQPRHKIL